MILNKKPLTDLPDLNIKQKRSKKTYNSLIKAGFGLLKKREWDSITVAELSRSTGYSVGAFYARFRSKEELLVALVSHHRKTRKAALEHFFASHNNDDFIDELIKDIVRYHNGFFITTELLAKNVIILKGSTLSENNLNGPLTIPYLKIQVASWGLTYSDDDLLIYDSSLRSILFYEDSIISTLPDPDDVITLTDGTTDTFINILDTKLFIDFETDTFYGLKRLVSKGRFRILILIICVICLRI